MCGTSAGTLACPGTSTPSTTNGLNCSCTSAAQCGTGYTCSGNPMACYFSLPDPNFSSGPASNPWKLPANGGTAQFCLNPASVTSEFGTITSPVNWSGGVFARTGCAADGTACATADCSASPNSDCAVGGNNPATIAEFTLQSSATDFYDVTLINGANIGEQMAPIPTATQTPGAVSTPYWCTTPGGSCAFNFAQYIKAVPLPAGSTTDYTTLLMDTSMQCSPNTGPPPTGCPSFEDSGGKFYICSGTAAPNSGACYKTCTSSSQCPTGLQCLEAGDGNSYCQCTAQSQCPTGQFCGTQFIPGLGSSTLSPQVFLQQCGTFAGWWTADDLCGAANNIIGSPTSPVLNCNGAIPAGNTNLASLFGCTAAGSNGNVNNSQSCYNSGQTGGNQCCGCATDSSNPLASLWPSNATDTCNNNNTTWASSVQPWLANLKQACPTAYSYPYDDPTSTFQCQAQGSPNLLGYNILFTDLPVPTSE
ncbi:MAG: thaumatin family protein [Candidatus Binataceae bacterium]